MWYVKPLLQLARADHDLFVLSPVAYDARPALLQRLLFMNG